MNKIQINSFAEIDFVSVDPNLDRFELPDGSIWGISEEICHSCWAGGAVMQNVSSGTFFCALCENELVWFEFAADFLAEEEGDTVSYLLPKNWGVEMRNDWFNNYTEARKKQEKIREDILKFGKGE
ncbi:MAG: hypothetical protein Kow0037_11780 [Calditrichia bacterium]